MIYQQHNAAADAPAEKMTDAVPLSLSCSSFAAVAAAEVVDSWVTADVAVDADQLSGSCSSFAAAVAAEMVSASSKVTSQ